ncbi:MAG: response regulator [Nitrospirota bacterium]|nr:response regulator [Nitrospirota bacterium]
MFRVEMYFSNLPELLEKSVGYRSHEKGIYLAVFRETDMNKILIIENDEQVRDSVSRSLESAGYVVMEAATYQEGLHNHKQFCAPVIISDVVSLEREEGEPLHRFRQQSPDIPIISLTGTVSDPDYSSSKTCPTLPMSLHTLQKPFTLDELLGTV